MTTTNNLQSDPLAKKVLERIERGRVKPRPRWEFLFKNYFFWTIGAAAVIFGAFACAAALFEITAVDWRLSVATHESFISFIVAAAPLLWILTLTLFILIGYLNVRRTNRGYRYPLAVIACGAVLTSLSLGLCLFVVGFGGAIDEALGDHMLLYRPNSAVQRSWWYAPERGLLIGTITTAVSNPISFLLHDYAGQSWNIDGSELNEQSVSALMQGGEVRIVGLPTSLSKDRAQPPIMSPMFHACFVFPSKHGELPGNMHPLHSASTTPRTTATTTISGACKSIRPYEQLHALEQEDAH